MDPPRLWERQTDETERAYFAFSIFRDDATRDLQKIANKLGHKNKSIVERWHSHHNWDRRAEAWQEYKDGIYFQENYKETDEIHDRHLREARLLQSIGIQGAEALLKQFDEGKDPDLTPREVADILRIGIQLEQSTIEQSAGIIGSEGIRRIQIMMDGEDYEDEEWYKGEEGDDET